MRKIDFTAYFSAKIRAQVGVPHLGENCGVFYPGVYPNPEILPQRPRIFIGIWTWPKISPDIGEKTEISVKPQLKAKTNLKNITVQKNIEFSCMEKWVFTSFSICDFFQIYFFSPQPQDLFLDLGQFSG